MKKTNKTRNSGTMTEAGFRGHIISALRQASRWWKPKQKCIAKARISKGKYECQLCHSIVPATLQAPTGKKKRIRAIQADHIHPAVPTSGWESYDSFIERLFVEEEGWQAICYKCHNEKTKSENEERKKKI